MLIAQHAYDILVFTLALGVPLYLVLRLHGLWIIPVAAVVFYFVIYVGGLILSGRQPAEHPSYLDQVWLRTGWIAGLIYASFLFIASSQSRILHGQPDA